MTLKEGGIGWLLACYRKVPGFAAVTEAGYRTVAENRPFFSAAQRLPELALGRPENFVLTRWVLLRAMALIYLMAFVSLAVQVTGLLGPDGILPANQLLVAVKNHMGSSSYWFFPTLCWLNASNGFLLFLTWGGAALALLLLLGIAPAICAALCWLSYLSLTTVGGDFLMFQWDALLLEAGFLTIWLAPWQWREWRTQPQMPSPLVIWLFRLLIFRFILFNGLVKLLSGDSSWSDLTALTYHYFTQPLPTAVAWWTIQAPPWFHKFCCAGMFVIELILPFGIFLGRRLRLVAGASFVALQTLILINGNYGFFNFLTIAIALSLLDDGWLRPRLPEKLTAWIESRRPLLYVSFSRECLLGVVGALIIVLNVFAYFTPFTGRNRLPDTIRGSLALLQPLELVNFYGAFAIMTRERPEIVIEGSDDGKTWKEYGFKYKAGDLSRAPVWAAPHQPRLDWQMWFAALEAPHMPFWFERLTEALLENNPEVTRLLAINPFPDRPPQYLRASLYQYQFTNSAERAATHHWWKREYVGAYMPQVNLQR